jgi:hypothetical protein
MPHRSLPMFHKSYGRDCLTVVSEDRTFLIMSFPQRSFSFFLLFLFIFSPRIGVFGGVNSGIVSVVLIMAVVGLAQRKLVLPKPLLLLAGYFCFLAIYSFVLATIYGNNPIYFVNICVSVFACTVFGWLFSKFLASCGIALGNILDELILLSALAIFLNSIIVVAEYLFPELKIFLESLLLQLDSSNIDYAEHAFRLRGLSSAGGAGLSIVNAVGVVLFVFLVSRKHVNSLLGLICSIIIAASNIFTGRTGLIFSLLFLGVLVLNLLVNGFRGGVSGIVRVLFLSLLLLFFASFAVRISLDAEASNWAFEWLNGLGAGKLTSASTDELASMLFLPQDVVHLFFGIGFFEGEGHIYARSDSGYVKTILSIGLILGASLYIVIAALFYRVTKVSAKYSPLVISILVFMFIVEVKEPFLYQNYAARFVFLLSGGALFVLRRQSLRVRPL